MEYQVKTDDSLFAAATKANLCLKFETRQSTVHNATLLQCCSVMHSFMIPFLCMGNEITRQQEQPRKKKKKTKQKQAK